MRGATRTRARANHLLTRTIFVGLVCVCSSPGANAEGRVGTGVHVEARGPLPFSRAALRRAVAARVITAQALRVVVRWRGLVAATVRVHVSVRRAGADARGGALSLPPADAEEAARAVALFVAELARPPLDVALPGDTATAGAVPAVVRRAAPAAATSAPRLRLGLLATVGSGVGGGRVRAGGQIDATVRLVGPLRLLVCAGLDVLFASQQQDVTLHAVSFAGRLGLALDLLGRRLSLRGWGVVEPFAARGRVGALEVTHTKVLGGAGVGAMYAFALSSRLQLTAALSAELFFNRLELLVRGAPTMASDRLALLAALGLRWSVLR